MFGLMSPLGLGVVGVYLYVAIMIGRAENLAGSTLPVVVIKALTWPLTIWSSVTKLYQTPPK